MKNFSRKKICAGAGVLLLGVSLFTLPLWAGETLLTRGGLNNLLQRYLTPKEQQIEALETRAAALEASVRQLESQAVSRLLLWPGKTAAELYRPGAGTPESRSLDVPPQIVGGRALVPLRFIGETLGAAVEWNGETRQITYVTEDRSIVLTLEKKTAALNGEPVEMDAAPMSVNGRTLVPVRFVGQWLGAAVNWDKSARCVEIKYYQAPEVSE